MSQTVERLALSADTYHLLERMAQGRSLTPSEFVEDLVRQYQTTESLTSLRQEYQRLTEKALMRTISRTEEKRMDALCLQMSTLNKRMNQEQITEQRHRQADELIEKSEHLLTLAQQQSTR